MRAPALFSAWRRRLWPAVLLPTLMSAVVMAIVFSASTLYLTATHEEMQNSESAAVTLNLLSLSAESFTLSGNLQRLVSFLGTDPIVESIVVASGNPRVVIASTRLEDLGTPLSEIDDHALRNHMTAIAARGGRQTPEVAPIADDGTQTHVRSIQLRLWDSPMLTGATSGEIGIRLKHRPSIMPWELVTASIAAALTGLAAATFALIWILRRRVQQPIKAIVDAMAAKGKTRVAAPYPDEFSTMAGEINAAFDSIDSQQAQLHKLAVIAEVASNLILISRADQTIEWVNAAFVKCVGYSGAECCGMRLPDVLSGRTDHRALEKLWDTATERGAAHGDLTFLASDGREIEVACESRALLHENGTIDRVVLILTDLTEAREIQRQADALAVEIRHEVAMALHDTLGGDLGGISFRAKLLEERLVTTNSPQAALASEIKAALVEAAGRTRDLSHLMAPTSAVSGGLAPALQRLCQAISRRFTDVDCAFKSTPIGEYPEWESAEVYLIVQEALRNATRHGTPSWIRVTLAPSNANIRVQVTSDGSRWDPRLARAGLGVRSMQYRAALLGAKFSIRSRPTAAVTSIRCIIPLRRQPVAAPLLGWDPSFAEDAGAERA